MANENDPKKKRKRADAPAATGDDALPAQPAPDAPPAEDAAVPIPVVGIGASAGGLAAFEAFFAAMPADRDTGVAIVLVQHLAPDHKSVLAELVKRYTRMQVHEAGNGMPVEPDCVYIIPPRHDLRLERGLLWTARHDSARRPRLTVDHFFTSLAAAQRERAICIVMSGSGSDGTLGLREVKGEGGLAIAQAPDTAEYDSMPRSAIATGMVDYVLAPAEMPARIFAYLRHAFDPARKPAVTPLRDGLLKKLCVVLRAQTGHDFSQYKETTLLRRMERRMALHQITQVEEYLRYARDNVQETGALFRDLLIGVTHFFRDPEAFDVLQEKVIPQLLAGKASQDTLRVWVTGCSTGEEAYSIAILLHEEMMRGKGVLKLQVFATDIDGRAIEQARSGLYPASIAGHVTEERLRRYFTHDAERGTYRIQKHIRDVLVFSEQNLIRDPPFSKLDLVSCRNLLIYLNGDLQRKLIPLFHYALVPGGALFLGTSETVGESARLFHTVDRKWKLYFRLPADRTASRPSLPEFVPPLFDPGERRTAPPALEEEPGNLRQVTERAMLAHFGHAGVLVDTRGQILHIVGRTGKFLEPADGDAAMNILSMAREGLHRELAIALHKAVAHKEPVSYPGLKVKANGHWIRADLNVRPVDAGGGAVAYLVLLEQLPESAEPEQNASPATADTGSRIAVLERDLRAKDEYLQTTLEEMETTNEELKSTNEEMQSVNEELQSTNEELETSKEELQSVNEELSTVNNELQEKVADLSRVNNDMNNLLAGTGVGTIFVDHDIRIARFTPAATQVINLIGSDVGRPLEHVASNLSNLVGYDRMIDDIRGVLDTLQPHEAELQVKGGAWYLMRIRPYRTMDNLIDGAVITLVDISERRRAEESLRLSEARLHAVINQAFANVYEMDLAGKLIFVNDRLCETLGFSRMELLGRRVADITDPADLARVRTQFDALTAGGAEVQLDKRLVRQDGRRVPVHERTAAIRDGDGRTTSLLSVSFVFEEGFPAK